MAKSIEDYNVDSFLVRRLVIKATYIEGIIYGYEMSLIFLKDFDKDKAIKEIKVRIDELKKEQQDLNAILEKELEEILETLKK